MMRSRFRSSLALAAGVALLAAIALWRSMGVNPSPLASAPSVARSATPAPAHAAAAPRPVAPTTSSLTLRLLATTVSDDPQRSRATIKDIDLASRYVVHVEQALPKRDGVIVRSIEPERVLIDDHGRTVVLPLDPDATLATALELPTLETMVADIGDGNNQERLASGIMKLHLARIGARDLDALSSHAVFAPEPDEGRSNDEIKGLRVMRVTGGSFYDQIGLQAGDLLLSVNGHRLDRPEVAEDAVDAFEHATEIRLVLEGPEGTRELSTRTVPVE